MSKTLTPILLIVAIAVGALVYSLLPYSNPPKTVDHVDLSRYVGVWYEIASVPLFFSKGCVCSTANYTANSDGTIRVENSCERNGARDAIVGKAWAVDDTNSKLKVEFYWPFSGDYWIVALDADYAWVVVSNPARDDLWILSRTVHLNQTLYDGLVANLKNDNFPVEQLVVTSSDC